MARYNTSLATSTISGTTTIGSPIQGAFIALTGNGGYTVTLPSPTLYPGSNQTFYNSTSPSGTVTLSTPAGIFTGTGGTNAPTVLCYTGNVLSVTSDGANYIVISEDGSALVATTGSFTGDVTMNGVSATVSITPQNVTLAPVSASNINNMNIGASTRGSGAFTSLTANAATTFTANTASTTTGTGSLVVTGGVGVSGQVTATSISATNLTGTIQTAAQANITSTGALTVPGLTATGTILSQVATTASAGSIQVTSTDAAIRLKWTSSPVADKNTWDIRSVGTGSTPFLQFRTINDANTVFTDRVAFTNDGNVGIGITNPGHKLDVAGTINAQGIQTSGTPSLSFGASKWMVQQETSSQSLAYYCGPDSSTYGTHFLYRATSTGSPQIVMTYSPGGFVGIGSTSTSTRVDIRGTSASSSATLQIVGNSVSTLLLGQDADGGVIRGQGGNNSIRFLVGGTADQAANGSGTESLRIVPSGVSFYADLYPSSNNGFSCGTSSNRWKNVFTNDLHLSNEGKDGGNSIDKTTGDWTIEEGAENLYIVNNKSGKKYAFVLKEIE